MRALCGLDQSIQNEFKSIEQVFGEIPEDDLFEQDIRVVVES